MYSYGHAAAAEQCATVDHHKDAVLSPTYVAPLGHLAMNALQQQQPSFPSWHDSSYHEMTNRGPVHNTFNSVSAPRPFESQLYRLVYTNRKIIPLG